MPCLYSMILEYSRRVEEARRNGNGTNVSLYRAINSHHHHHHHNDDHNDVKRHREAALGGDEGIQPWPSPPKMRDDAADDASSAADAINTQAQDARSAVKRGRRSRPKVKTGCSNCKQRRIKCDEARPACTQCVRSKKECTGYPPPPRNLRPDHEVRIAPRPALAPLGAAPPPALAAAPPPSLAPAPPIRAAPGPPPLQAGPQLQTAYPMQGPSPAPTPRSSIASSPHLPSPVQQSRRPSVLNKVLHPRQSIHNLKREHDSQTPETLSQISDIPPSLPPLMISREQHSGSLPPIDTESSYFRTFVEQTASELSGFFDSPFYNDRVLEASYTEPAIRHAATALGALYKTLEQPPSSPLWARNPSISGGSPNPPPIEHGEQGRHWQVAFKQYSEALRAMLALRDPSQNSLRTQLMTCVLLASFDSFVGDYKQAILQIQSGLELHERIRKAERLPAYGATEAVEEELTIIFMRLAIQAKSYDLAFHFPQPYVVKFVSPGAHQAHMMRQSQQGQQQQSDTMDSYSAPSRILPPENEGSPASTASPCTPILPHTFSSLKEARIAHDRLNERVIRFQESLSIRPKEAYHTSAPGQWLSAMSAFKQQLTSWARAFEHILASRHDSHLGRRERAGIAALQMAHLNAIIISCIQFSNTEMAFDEYVPIFRSIVEMGLEIVTEQEKRGAMICREEHSVCPHRTRHGSTAAQENQAAGIFSPLHIKPTFSMDLGIVAPLFVVATKCREPVLRRQAIELLSGSATREGMWDSELTARVGQWVMMLEEGHPDTVVGGGYGGHVHGFPSLGTGGLAEGRGMISIPEERRLTVKSLEFDLRARQATVCVGTRGLPDGVDDPRAKQTRITW